jgi:cation:H+ antiporter
MNLVAWILVGCASAVVMAIGSRVAIRHAVAVAELLEVSPFLVGVTLVAVGTDVPEIANSVVASYAGHGDITLGDTTGSVFTQITLCLGVFPFVAGFAIAVVRRDVWLLATLTAVGIVLCALLYRDGSLTRQDAVVLLAFWCAATAVSWQLGARPPPRPSVGGAAHGHWVAHAAKAIVALALVGGASALLVGTVMAVSEAAGVPEYLLSFFGAALATSLPELTVEITAIRRGQRDIALGAVLG